MDPLLAQVREADRSAYLALLLAPDAVRPSLTALAAYACELARIPLIVSEPMAGEVRLTWWAEVARGERDGEARANPLASALLDAIEAHGLSRDALADMADVRSFDLYADPMPDTAAFEDYAGRVGSLPIQLAAQIIDPAAAARAGQAAGHAGVYAVAMDRLATLARDRAAGRCFLPADALMRAWLSPADLGRPDLRTKPPGAADALVREWLSTVGTYGERARADCASLPASLHPAFAAALSRRALARAISRAGGETVDRMVEPSPLAQQAALARSRALFVRTEGGLLGRLRERLLRRPG